MTRLAAVPDVPAWAELVQLGGQLLDAIHEAQVEADRHLLELLRAPEYAMTSWVRSDKCAYLGHPTRKVDDPPGAPCVCGRRTS